MVRKLSIIVMLVAALCLCWPAAALAAGITVQGEAGVSQMLMQEFTDMAVKVTRFYQEVYGYQLQSDVRLIVTADEASYLRTLEQQGVKGEYALRNAKASAGLTLLEKQVIIICIERRPDYWSRLRLVAHEVFHLVQRELSQGRESHQWMLEGSARAVEMAMLEWLGAGSVHSERQKLLNLLLNVKLKAGPLDMVDNSRWLDLMEQRMYPYETSELMALYLISKNGPGSLLAYYRYLGSMGWRDMAFQQAFGCSHQQFISDYNDYLLKEEATLGKLNFVAQPGVSQEQQQRILRHGMLVEQLLRRQGWPLSKSQQFIVVAGAEDMVQAILREAPQIKREKAEQVAGRGTAVSLGITGNIMDAGRIHGDSDQISRIMWYAGRNAMQLASGSASASSIWWLQEGTLRLMVCQALEAAGIRTVAQARQEWLAVVKKSPRRLGADHLKISSAEATARYGSELINAYTALAVQHLLEQQPPGQLLRYFALLKDLQDGDRAFQQAFGMRQEEYLQQAQQHIYRTN